MRFSTANVYGFALERGEKPYFGKSYRYNFKSINKFNYIYLKKELGVNSDEILIPKDEAVDVLNKILKDNKLNLHNYINRLEDKEIVVGIPFNFGLITKYKKICLDFLIDYFKKL